MRVLITGGFGFIGSNFVNLLDAENHDILIIDKMTYASHQGNVKNQDIKFLNLDIFNKENLMYHYKVDLMEIIQQYQRNLVVTYQQQTNKDLIVLRTLLVVQ